MWHIGVDLHRKTAVIAAVHDSGEVRPPVRLQKLLTAARTQKAEATRKFAAGELFGLAPLL